MTPIGVKSGDAPVGSNEWKAWEKRAYAAARRRLKRILTTPTRSGEVYISFTFGQVIEGQYFEVNVTSFLRELGARPGSSFPYCQVPKMENPARDFWADWAAATSPEIETNRAEWKAADMALSDLEGEVHEMPRKLARAYNAGDRHEAERLAQQWHRAEERYRRGKDLLETLNLECDRMRWALMAAKDAQMTLALETTSVVSVDPKQRTGTDAGEEGD